MDCSALGSSVHGILQAGILGWVAMPSSRGSSRPRDPTQGSDPGIRPTSPALAGRCFTSEPPGKCHHTWPFGKSICRAASLHLDSPSRTGVQQSAHSTGSCSRRSTALGKGRLALRSSEPAVSPAAFGQRGPLPWRFCAQAPAERCFLQK